MWANNVWIIFMTAKKKNNTTKKFYDSNKYITTDNYNFKVFFLKKWLKNESNLKKKNQEK